jgi:hypothetical protein
MPVGRLNREHKIMGSLNFIQARKPSNNGKKVYIKKLLF